MRKLLLYIFIGYTFISHFIGYAGVYDQIRLREHSVPAADGVIVHLIEFPTPHSPKGIKVLTPGIYEDYRSLSKIALAFSKNYKVFIGHVRGTHPKKHPLSNQHQYGLTEVLTLDLPAHFRYIQKLPHFKSWGKIHLIGHSMGGMQVMALLSSSEFSDFKNDLKAATVIGSPARLNHSPPEVIYAAKKALPLFKTLRSLNQHHRTQDIHTHFFKFTQKLKNAPFRSINFLGKAIETIPLEIGIIVLYQTIFQRDLTQKKEMIRLLRQGVTPVPYSLLEGFANALVEPDGRVLDKDNNEIIQLEKITLPFQLVVLDQDKLVPLQTKREMIKRLKSKIVQIVLLKGVNHVDPITTQIPDMLRLIETFGSNPANTQKERVINLKPSFCERLWIF